MQVSAMILTTPLSNSDRAGAFSFAGVAAALQFKPLSLWVAIDGNTLGSSTPPIVSSRRRTLSRRDSTRPSRSLSDARSASRVFSGSGKSWLRQVVPLARHSRQLWSPSETKWQRTLRCLPILQSVWGHLREGESLT